MAFRVLQANTPLEQYWKNVSYFPMAPPYKKQTVPLWWQILNYLNTRHFQNTSVLFLCVLFLTHFPCFRHLIVGYTYNCTWPPSLSIAKRHTEDLGLLILQGSSRWNPERFSGPKTLCVGNSLFPQLLRSLCLSFVLITVKQHGALKPSAGKDTSVFIWIVMVLCFVLLGCFVVAFFFLHIVTDCNPVLAFLLLFVLLSGLTIFAAITTITNGKFQCYPIFLCLRKFAFSQTESCFCLSSFADFSFTTSWAMGYFL